MALSLAGAPLLLLSCGAIMVATIVPTRRLRERSIEERRTRIGLLCNHLVSDAPLRIPERTKQGIVRWWPRITSALLVIVLLLMPFLKIWLSLADFGASFGGAGEILAFRCLEAALVVQWSLAAISLPAMFRRKAWGWNLVLCERIVGIAIGLLAIPSMSRAAHVEGMIAVVSYILLQLFKMFLLVQVRSLFE